MFRSNQSNHIFTPQLKRFIEPRDYITFSAFLEGGGGIFMFDPEGGCLPIGKSNPIFKFFCFCIKYSRFLIIV